MVTPSERAKVQPERVPTAFLRRPVWLLALGITLVVLGALAILMPQVSTLAVELVIAYLFLLSGFIYGWSAFSMRGGWKIAGSIIIAILSIVVGGLLLFNPMQGVLTLTIVMAIFFIASGAVKTYFAATNRQYRGWGWGVASGLASLALGVLVLVGWPSTAAWVLGLLFGIDLVIAGIALISLYPTVKSHAEAA